MVNKVGIRSDKDVAPIAFFVYRRLDHTKQTLEALKSNALASDSDLYIFSDGPKDESVNEAVEAVRSYVRSIEGFKSVTLIEREKNNGLAKSLISGITDLCNKFGRVIVLEDDVLVSKVFLEFMNDGLNIYKDNEEIFSICGFWPVAPLPEEKSAFFLDYFAVWGWATWKRAWDYYDYEASGWEELLKNRRMAWNFDLEGRFDFTSMLLTQVQENINTWDIQWYWTIYSKKRLALFPPYSLTTNVGFDNLGTHTVSSGDNWIVRDIDLRISKIITMPLLPELNQRKRSALGKFCYSSIKNRFDFSLHGIFWFFYRQIRYVTLIFPFRIKLKFHKKYIL